MGLDRPQQNTRCQLRNHNQEQGQHTAFSVGARDMHRSQFVLRIAHSRQEMADVLQPQLDAVKLEAIQILTVCHNDPARNAARASRLLRDVLGTQVADQLAHQLGKALLI